MDLFGKTGVRSVAWLVLVGLTPFPVGFTAFSAVQSRHSSSQREIPGVQAQPGKFGNSREKGDAGQGSSREGARAGFALGKELGISCGNSSLIFHFPELCLFPGNFWECRIPIPLSLSLPGLPDFGTVRIPLSSSRSKTRPKKAAPAWAGLPGKTLEQKKSLAKARLRAAGRIQNDSQTIPGIPERWHWPRKIRGGFGEFPACGMIEMGWIPKILSWSKYSRILWPGFHAWDSMDEIPWPEFRG